MNLIMSTNETVEKILKMRSSRRNNKELKEVMNQIKTINNLEKN